jgi:hypothetical protein
MKSTRTGDWDFEEDRPRVESALAPKACGMLRPASRRKRAYGFFAAGPRGGSPSTPLMTSPIAGLGLMCSLAAQIPAAQATTTYARLGQG